MHDSRHFTDPPGRRIGALALIRDASGDRVLMVEKRYRTGPARWGLVGGCAEAGEDARAACRRETCEEIGLDITPGPLLAVHYMPPATSAEGYNLVFDCGQIQFGAEIRLNTRELISHRFMTLDELREEAAPYIAERVHSALRALHGQPTIYLIGHPG